MSQITHSPTINPRLIGLFWWPISLGLAALYMPTFYNLSNGIWQLEDQAHGPLILLVVLYLFWKNRKDIVNLNHPSPAWGWPVFVFGLGLYVIGRSQGILMFEIGSLVPVMAGILLLTYGKSAVKIAWFALFFTLFMIPLPSFVVDGITGPLKQTVSQVAEVALYHAGYPVARSGVTILIGQYQLLVADACSGINSMFSLSALGMLYLYLEQHKSWPRNIVIIASILPIAFFANVLRVMTLVLVTYYFGDEAGQGFVHGAAGMLLFLAALVCLFLLDKILSRFPIFK